MSNDLADWLGLRLEQGRYHVRALLGAGGMGTVYRARDAKLEVDVVIKVPHRRLLASAQSHARFKREIRALVQLAHPHIVKVLDCGEHDGLPFVVMQYLPGGSLRDRLQLGPDGQSAPMPPEGLRSWLPDVADALDYIHAEGYLHRDVKPHNILLDAAGKAYVSDFGLARAVDDGTTPQDVGLTAPQQLVGTPSYMAPEVGQERAYDRRVDQYALAVTVYQWLCGRPPFEGPWALVLGLHQVQAPPPLRRWVPSLAPAVEAAVLRALSKDPEARHADCRDFARAVLSGPAAPARPLPASGPARPARKSRRLAPWLAAGCVAALALAGAGWAVFRGGGPPRSEGVTSARENGPLSWGREVVNSVGMTFVRVPSGIFRMGSPATEEGRFRDESQRDVEIARPFYLGVHEVPQRQFLRVMKANPSRFSPSGAGADLVKGLDPQTLPVERVLLDEARDFCKRLTELPEEKAAGRVYRLPTEAEWEYACRAGTATAFHFGDQLTGALANFEDALGRTAPVGSYPANAWGLFDLHGNVWEWCEAEPVGVLRGGSWTSEARFCRAARRYAYDPVKRVSSAGFRVVLESPR